LNVGLLSRFQTDVKLLMQVLVRFWTLVENKHVGASQMLGFQCGCQSDAGL